MQLSDYVSWKSLWLLFRRSCFLPALLLLLVGIDEGYAQTISFTQKSLNFNGNGSISNGTALQFGPDGRLYATQRYGEIQVFEVEQDVNEDYIVTSSVTLNQVKNIPNHFDDGTINGGQSSRQITGILVKGTADNPVIYVASTDATVGGPSGDKHLDTNSGILTKISWKGTTRDDPNGEWEAVDLVRGLPRSEENHAPNGLECATINGVEYLFLTIGGFTNAGSPSKNFAYISEYALSACVLWFNLDELNDATKNPVMEDQSTSRNYVFDVPTLDDPTRPNANGINDPNANGYDGIDEGDPFGGHDGLNQGKLVPDERFGMFSAGYRNTYDLAITQDGHVYVTDNGANNGWGGYPNFEADPTKVNNDYRSGEPGSPKGEDDTDNSEPAVNNSDHLNLVTTNINTYTFGSVYGGHPCPVRANTSTDPATTAGLFTKETDAAEDDHTGDGGKDDEYFRTVPYDPNGSGDAANPKLALPADWPPVHPSLAFAPNADFRQPDLSGNANPDGEEDIIVIDWPNNTNAIAEYTASNFGGQMQGDLIAGKNGGSLHRVDRDSNGDIIGFEQNKFSGLGGNCLGLTCQGDNDPFPGTIWVATFNSNIIILVPDDAFDCPDVADNDFDPELDYDGDQFTNQDEIDNGTDYCSGSSQPEDFDGDKVSNLNDTDDDDDTLNDNVDPFQLGEPFDLPVINELFSDTELGGYLGLGLTGFMNDGSTGENWLVNIDDPEVEPNDILGGAVGAVTIYQTDGSAFSNNQEKAFQYGVNVSTNTGLFTVTTKMISPFADWTSVQYQGLQIGTGFQDNFIGIFAFDGGLKVEGENNDVKFSGASTAFPSTPTNSIELFFVVDPSAGTIQPRFRIDDGAVTDLGSPISAQGGLLNAIQLANTPLAVGFMGTKGGGEDFAANYDYLNVTGSAPFVENAIADITRDLGANAENFQLNEIFADDNGDDNLNFKVQLNSNSTDFGANIDGSILTITFPDIVAVTEITIRATDGDGLFVDETFIISVVDEPTPLYRINCGAGNLSATDEGGPDWSSDTGGSPSDFLIEGGGKTFSKSADIPSFVRSSSLPAYVPDAIFNNERYDVPAAPNMKWEFPVEAGKEYIVRLYVLEGFDGVSTPGERVFNVEVEGSVPAVFNSIDPIALSSSSGQNQNVGNMVEYKLTVEDETLSLIFIHQTQNPAIRGIEILSTSPVIQLPLTVADIDDQENLEGDLVNLAILASGGDPSEGFDYDATGLPPGLQVETSTGLIFGSIAAEAAAGSPYNVNVTVDKTSSPTSNTSFVWTISVPDNCAPISDVEATTIEASEASNIIDNTPGTGDNDIAVEANDAQNIGFINGNDAAQFLICVSTAGEYKLTASIASANSANGGNITFKIGDNVVGTLTLDPANEDFPTGDWQTYADYETTLDLPLGDNQILTLEFSNLEGSSGNMFNLDKLTFEPTNLGPQGSALIEINKDSNSDEASTFGGNSVQITNTGELDITSITLNISTALLPDVVFDPLGTAGDSGSKCLTEGSSTGDVGLTIPGDGGSDGTDPDCSTAYGFPHNGVDSDDGYDQLNLTFTDFNPGEIFSFAADIDPTTIKGNNDPDHAGAISGLELVGSTFTVTFSDNSTLTGNIWDQGSFGGGQLSLSNSSPKVAPVLEVVGINNLPAEVYTPEQQIKITGPANAVVCLLQVDARQFIIPDQVYDLDPFEANESLTRNLIENIQLDENGEAIVDVTLLQTITIESEANGGYNFFVAVVKGSGAELSPTSNKLLLQYIPPTYSTLIQITPGTNFFVSTFGDNSFVITNNGQQDISKVSIDMSTTYLPDLVYDPTGKAGNPLVKCLTTGNSGNTASEVGLTVPGDGGTDAEDCESVFDQPHNGVDDEEGYDVLNLEFTDFNPSEVYAFGLDTEPTSIKGEPVNGNAGQISGFEFIGATVTIEYADGTVLTGSMWDEGSNGGSALLLTENSPTESPIIGLDGVAQTPVLLSEASQQINILGPANATVCLLQVDARLFINDTHPTGGYDLDPFEANQAIGRNLIEDIQLDENGEASVPVTLLKTASPDEGPVAGINHFIAVVKGSNPLTGSTSNVIIVEFDPEAAVTADLSIDLGLQTACTGLSAVLSLYEPQTTNLIGTYNGTTDSDGKASFTGLPVGTFDCYVKVERYLQKTISQQELLEGANSLTSSLIPGDAVEDQTNSVDDSDLNALLTAYGLKEGDEGYNASCDFDCNGAINMNDLSTLLNAYGSAGDIP